MKTSRSVNELKQEILELERNLNSLLELAQKEYEVQILIAVSQPKQASLGEFPLQEIKVNAII